MNTYSQQLEAEHIASIKSAAQAQGFEARIHIGGSANPSCALVSFIGGGTFVFSNLEELVRHLFRAEDRDIAISEISLEGATVSYD